MKYILGKGEKHIVRQGEREAESGAIRLLHDDSDGGDWSKSLCKIELCCDRVTRQETLLYEACGDMMGFVLMACLEPSYNNGEYSLGLVSLSLSLLPFFFGSLGFVQKTTKMHGFQFFLKKTLHAIL